MYILVLILVALLFTHILFSPVKLKDYWVMSLYKKRFSQSRKWFDRFGRKNKKKIREFLQIFAACYYYPEEDICKLSPDDEVIKFFNRDHILQDFDCFENEMFYDFIKENYGLEMEEALKYKTLGDLFEKVLINNI